MDWLARFFGQPSSRYRNFQLVFLFFTLNFIFPSLSYAVSPDTAYAGFLKVGAFLWSAPYPKAEDSYFWRFLGASNVFCLGAMCLFLQIDLKRYYPILPSLLILKAGTSLQFLVHFAFVLHHPSFLVIGLYDALTCAGFVWFARSAHRDGEARGWKGLVPAPRSSRGAA